MEAELEDTRRELTESGDNELSAIMVTRGCPRKERGRRSDLKGGRCSVVHGESGRRRME